MLTHLFLLLAVLVWAKPDQEKAHEGQKGKALAVDFAHDDLETILEEAKKT